MRTTPLLLSFTVPPLAILAITLAAAERSGSEGNDTSRTPVVWRPVQSVVSEYAASRTEAGLYSDAAALLPADTPIAMTLIEPDMRLGDLRGFLAEWKLANSPLLDELLSNPGLAAARIGLAGLAASAEMDSWTAMASLLGRETTIGLLPRPNGGDAAVVAVSIARDEEAMDRFIRQVNIATGAMRGNRPNPQLSTEIDGVRIFKLGEAFHCRISNALILCNDEDLMRRTIATAQGKGETLAQQSRYIAAATAAPRGVAGFALLDLVTFRALDPDNGLFREKLVNAMSGYLFGGWAASLRNSDVLHAAITLRDNRLAIDFAAPTTPDAWDGPVGSFLNRSNTVPGWRSADIKGSLGEITVQRDWHALFADREALLEVKAAGDVVNFATTLSAIMGQVDFMDDVLARVNGPTRLVMAQQDFAAMQYQPTPKLPGFALAVPLNHADDPEFADLIRSAALGAITVIGLDQAQKQQPSLLPRLENYSGIDLVYGSYRTPREGDGRMMAGDVVAIQYNFTPAIAMVGDEFVIATTRELLHAIIDASRKHAGESVAVTHDSAAIHADTLAAVLRDNLDELVVNRMLQESVSRAEAEAFFEMVFTAMEHADSLSMTSDVSETGLKGRVELGLRDLR
ncbi:MAG: hypothetical protein ACR2GY_03605 [Phycisphaerales bacterium]